MRYAFVAEHRGQFSIRAMCRCLRIQPSGFYAWLQAPMSQRARSAPHPCEIHPSCLCPWFLSFAAHYVIKGEEPNRDRSILLVLRERTQPKRRWPRVSTQPRREADIQEWPAERLFLDHLRRHEHLKKMSKPQGSWRHRNLLPPDSKSRAFAGSNVTRILWPDRILVSELPCKARVNETPERVFV